MIAEVVPSLAGPTLKIFGIPVQTWLGTQYDRECHALARKINAAPAEIGLVLVNARKVDALQVWYAIFTALLDMPEAGETNDQLVGKMRLLRERIRAEIPDEEQPQRKPRLLGEPAEYGDRLRTTDRRICHDRRHSKTDRRASHPGAGRKERSR